MMKATNPHFFNIILSDTFSQGKLVIPRMFVKRFGVYLSDNVFLRVPSGSKWQVELVKNGDCIYFGNGWQQFVDYYSISHGSFLVFGMENCSTCCFNVTIFDKSATEIDYPFNDKQLHEIVIPHITGSHVSNRPCKKQFQVNKCNPDRSAKRKHFLTNTKIPKLVKRDTTSYKSGNPSFSITMHTSHISRKYQVTVPATTAIQYLREQRGRIILSSVDGRTWFVDYASYRKNWGGKVTIISRGWREFVLDNRLKVGDVCVFELINGNAEKVKVVICRKGGDAKTILSKIHMPNCNGPNQLASPLSEYSEAGIYNERIGVLNSVDGKTWSVEYVSYRTSCETKLTMISRGWREFVHDNHLTVGDVCVFELTNGNANELQVVSSRKDGNNKMVPSTGYKNRLTSIENGGNSSKLNTSNPYFKVKLTQNHVGRRCLYLPTNIMEKCKNRSAEKAMLQVENRVWPVKLLCYPSHRVFQLSLGLSAFLNDNSLRVGDACGFELISSKPFWLKVCIFRGNR